MTSYATDLATLREHLADFFAQRTRAEWQKHTEPRNRGWTLKQTVAHLAIVAKEYQRAIDSALQGESEAKMFGLQQRTDLPAWNEAQIAQKAQLPVDQICEELLQTLSVSEETAVSLSPDQLSQAIHIPAYNHPMTVGQLLGAQAAHPGLIHAAQLANGVGSAPLWQSYAPDFHLRLLTHTLQLMAFSYWPERGGNLTAVLHFAVRRPQPTHWQIEISPEGGRLAGKRPLRPTLSLWFRDTHTLSQTLTFQLSPIRAILTGKVFAWGNVLLGLRLPHLFNPT